MSEVVRENKTKNKLEVSLSIAVLGLFVLFIGASRFFPPLGDLKYGIPLLLILFPLLNKKPISLEAPYNLLAKLTIFFFLYWLAGIFFYYPYSPGFLAISAKELLLLVFPFISVLVIKDYISWERLHKFLVIITYFFICVEAIRSNFRISSVLNIKQFLIHSQAESETPYALAYGAIFIYFFMQKNWKMSILSALLIILGGKRIAVGAVFLVAVTYPILKYISVRKPKFVKYAMILSNGVIVLVLYLLATHYFDDLIQEYTGLVARGFTKGRSTAYEYVLNQVDMFFPFGSGLASSSFMLRGRPLELMHSDILKIFVETGWIGFILYFYWFYSIGDGNPKVLGALIYINIIMFSGNSMIYFHVTFINYLIIFLLVEKDRLSIGEGKTQNLDKRAGRGISSKINISNK